MASRSDGVFLSRRFVSVPAHGIYEESSVKKHELGDVLPYRNKLFVYCLASEALSAGKLLTSKTTIQVEDTVTVAHPIGTTDISMTGDATAAANLYADGLLVVDEGTGAGEQYEIKSHPALASATVATIKLKDPLMTAWAVADTDITLVTNPFYVQESNTDQIEHPVGVPLISVTNAYYFWAQARGECAVLQDEAFGNATNQREVTIGSSVAGSVEALDAACEPIVGEVLLDGANSEDAKYMPIYLRCL